jgi:uncharacterized protein (TIGR02996 family)
LYPIVTGLLALGLASTPAGGAPFTPASDEQVLERLPLGASDPRRGELASLRERHARDPANPALAAELARRFFAVAVAEGDPRWAGHAQAVLAPWWKQTDPPPDLRVVRAMLLQHGRRFDAAVADLNAAVQAEPAHLEAWSRRAGIHMAQARYVEARRDCERVAALASPLVGATCRAQVDASTGRAGAASGALRTALAQAREADPAERVWSLARLAEFEERRGEYAAAEAAFRDALALRPPDVDLRAAYADFLLDRGRPFEVLQLLEGAGRADVLVLRRALAARALGQPAAAELQRELAARFDASRRRGDAWHEKEESRFALALLGDKVRALALARSNFQVQREPADARVLLEAALVARDRAAAAPVLQWMADSGIESVALHALMQQIGALR